MKILQLLNEGIIKVPEAAYNIIMQTICTDIFSRIFTYVSQPKIEDDYPELHDIYSRLVSHYRKVYGNFDIWSSSDDNTDTSRSIPINMKDIDPRYLSRNKQDASKVFKLSLIITSTSEREAQGEYHRKSPGKPAHMLIRVPVIEKMKYVITSPENVAPMIERLAGIVKHELIHGVQDMAMRGISDKTVDYYDTDGKLDNDKYYTSDIEFGPQIVSAASEFKSSIKELRNSGYQLNDDTERKLLMRFINPSLPDVAGIENIRSDFFDTLYRKDKQQWKKAIKYFYGLLEAK